ncbi:L-2-haloalkanoic acid dehalogenase [Staphylococcus aureus]|uniref:L-2-haloalkanoic acid dehalogenase n=1 Tax=Staphylococcus aureus TaxID=1280 RepID=A0A380EGR3_STAAU|nr:L-2-haloalkanoic acid dehalogenase [Staphylococcus aureus]
MYVGDDALNDVAPARAMGMVSVWYKQEDAEIEPLEEEVDFTITTVEELLTILPIKMIIRRKLWIYLLEKMEHRYITVH